MGAGYSGLRQITTVLPDYLKLDRALVSGIDADPDRAALVAALTGYSKQVGSLLIAEGVETTAELQGPAGDRRPAGAGLPSLAPGRALARGRRRGCLRASHPRAGAGVIGEPAGVIDPSEWQAVGPQLERTSSRSTDEHSLTEHPARRRLGMIAVVVLPYDDLGTGPVVLLLHAGIADRRMWSEHLKPLSRPAIA